MLYIIDLDMQVRPVGWGAWVGMVVLGWVRVCVVCICLDRGNGRSCGRAACWSGEAERRVEGRGSRGREPT